MSSKLLLSRGIGVITVLLSAFGGALTEFAPPKIASVNYALGLGSFACLLSLFIVIAVKKLFIHNARVWFWTAIFFIAVSVISAGYYVYLDRMYVYEDARIDWQRSNGGDVIHPDIMAFWLKEGKPATSDLIAKTGWKPHLTWTPESINKISFHLLVSYIILLLGLSFSIFSFTEGIFSNKQSSSGQT